ncbi:hypothetical protein [Nocardiopsis sp. NPDC006938]|uniref:hypothetical protein n=1 Tax=Nocardiopsis sp. NPDC006938 TaxID=3364337 RepID=UPI0036BAE80D
MSTAPEDNDRPENTTSTGEGSPQPKFEPGVTADTGTAETADSAEDGFTGAEHGEEYAFVAVEPEPRPGGGFSTETLSIVGVALLAVTISSGQLLELLTSMIMLGGQPIDAGQIRSIEAQLWMGGAVALLTVLASALALTLLNAGSRSWARWTATATLVVGVLFVLVAAAAFLLVPDAAPQQMLPPMPN